LALDAVASHRSAAALHGLDGFTLGHPEVLVGSRSGRRVGLPWKVTLRRTNALPQSHVCLVDGIPATTVARTLCDLARCKSAASLGRLVDDARRTGLISYAEVAQCRTQMPSRGRPRLSAVDEVLGKRLDGYDPGGSQREPVVRAWLEAAGLPPVVQHRVVVAGKRRELDLAYPQAKVAVEYLGYAGHSGRDRFDADAERTSELQLAGWLVIFATSATRRADLVRRVRRALAQRPSGPRTDLARETFD